MYKLNSGEYKMDVTTRIEYFKTLKECEDGTNIKWFIFNAKKQGATDEEIVRELQIRNNMAVASSSYAVLIN